MADADAHARLAGIQSRFERVRMRAERTASDWVNWGWVAAQMFGLYHQLAMAQTLREADDALR